MHNLDMWHCLYYKFLTVHLRRKRFRVALIYTVNNVKNAVFYLFNQEKAAF